MENITRQTTVLNPSRLAMPAYGHLWTSVHLRCRHRHRRRARSRRQDRRRGLCSRPGCLRLETADLLRPAVIGTSPGRGTRTGIRGLRVSRTAIRDRSTERR